MAIAAADSTIKEMDKHIKELEKKGESKVFIAHIAASCRTSPLAHELPVVATN